VNIHPAFRLESKDLSSARSARMPPSWKPPKKTTKSSGFGKIWEIVNFHKDNLNLKWPMVSG